MSGSLTSQLLCRPLCLVFLSGKPRGPEPLEYCASSHGMRVKLSLALRREMGVRYAGASWSWTGDHMEETGALGLHVHRAGVGGWGIAMGIANGAQRQHFPAGQQDIGGLTPRLGEGAAESEGS